MRIVKDAIRLGGDYEANLPLRKDLAHKVLSRAAVIEVGLEEEPRSHYLPASLPPPGIFPALSTAALPSSTSMADGTAAITPDFFFRGTTPLATAVALLVAGRGPCARLFFCWEEGTQLLPSFSARRVYLCLHTAGTWGSLGIGLCAEVHRCLTWPVSRKR